MVAKRIALWIVTAIVVMTFWSFFLPPQGVGTIGAGIVIGAWLDVKKHRAKIAQNDGTEGDS